MDISPSHVVVGIVTGATAMVALVLLKPVGSPADSIGLVIAAIPATYAFLRLTPLFDYGSFRRDAGLVRTIGWVLAAVFVMGIPGVVLGTTASVFLPTDTSIPFMILHVVLVLVPLWYAWQLVVRWNPEYYVEQETEDAQPS